MTDLSYLCTRINIQQQRTLNGIKDMRKLVILFALMLSITAVAQETEKMIVRLAEIEVYPQYLKEYLEFANEVDRLSIEREPGVICLYPMQSAEDSCQIRILEIYASDHSTPRL